MLVLGGRGEDVAEQLGARGRIRLPHGRRLGQDEQDHARFGQKPPMLGGEQPHQPTGVLLLACGGPSPRFEPLVEREEEQRTDREGDQQEQPGTDPGSRSQSR